MALATKSPAFGYLMDFASGVAMAAGVVTGIELHHRYMHPDEDERTTAKISKKHEFVVEGDNKTTIEHLSVYCIDEDGVKSPSEKATREWTSNSTQMKGHLEATKPAYDACMVEITKFRAEHGEKAHFKFWEVKGEGHPRNQYNRVNGCISVAKDWWRTALFYNDEFRELREKSDVYAPLYRTFIREVKPLERFASQAENDAVYNDPIADPWKLMIKHG